MLGKPRFSYEMKVLKDFKNELLHRREVKLVLEAEQTPSYEESKNLLEKEFKANPEAVVIHTVKGKFGRKTFLIDAKLYDSKEAMNNTETKTQKQRKAEAAAKAEEEKKKAEEEKKKAEEETKKAEAENQAENTEEIKEENKEVSE